jgi:hypothetical protein
VLPPVAINVTLYPCPLVAFGTEVVEIESGAEGAEAIFSESVALAVCAGDAVSVTLNPRLNVPDVLGVPDRTPFEFSVKPAGSAVVADHVYGLIPPLALSVVE